VKKLSAQFVANENAQQARAAATAHAALVTPIHPQREFFIENLLVRIHVIIEMILVDRPFAMGV